MVQAHPQKQGVSEVQETALSSYVTTNRSAQAASEAEKKTLFIMTSPPRSQGTVTLKRDKILNNKIVKRYLLN